MAQYEHPATRTIAIATLNGYREGTRIATTRLDDDGEPLLHLFERRTRHGATIEWLRLGGDDNDPRWYTSAELVDCHHELMPVHYPEDPAKSTTALAEGERNPRGKVIVLASKASDVVVVTPSTMEASLGVIGRELLISEDIVGPARIDILEAVMPCFATARKPADSSNGDGRG